MKEIFIILWLFSDFATHICPPSPKASLMNLAVGDVHSDLGGTLVSSSPSLSKIFRWPYRYTNIRTVIVNNIEDCKHEFQKKSIVLKI